MEANEGDGVIIRLLLLPVCLSVCQPHVYTGATEHGKQSKVTTRPRDRVVRLVVRGKGRDMEFETDHSSLISDEMKSFRQGTLPSVPLSIWYLSSRLRQQESQEREREREATRPLARGGGGGRRRAVRS